MYANINEVWDNNNMYPLLSTHNDNQEINNIYNTNKYKSLNERIDKNILIEEPELNIMGTKINNNNHHNNNHNNYHQNYHNIEHFSSDINKDYDIIDEEVYEPPKKLNCRDYITHVLQCTKCLNILKKKLIKKQTKINIIDNFLTDNVKEILIVILIGIFIILILDIFVRILDKN